MNTALYEMTKSWSPVQGLLRWMMPTIIATECKPVQAASLHPATMLKVDCGLATKRPLRIVRILEADHAPANVGRMMISGRMADVCAELDRLAARESAMH